MVSQTSFAVSARILVALALVLGIAPLCIADSITYDVNLQVGAATVTGNIITDGTIGTLNGGNIVGWNLLVTDGAYWFDENSSSPTSLGLYFHTDDLSATASQLLFNFSGTDSPNFMYFTGVTNPGEYDWGTQFTVCFQSEFDACVDVGGAEAVLIENFNGVGDLFPYTSLSGTQVIGTGGGSSPTPEPSAVALLGTAMTLLVTRKACGKKSRSS